MISLVLPLGGDARCLIQKEIQRTKEKEYVNLWCEATIGYILAVSQADDSRMGLLQ